MLSRVYSSGVLGIDGFEVCVECSAWDRLPRFELVGLGDTAVKEAKNRVRSACENSGFNFPPLEIMINLAPADIKKEGTAFDLAIIAAIFHECCHYAAIRLLCRRPATVGLYSYGARMALPEKR